MPPRASPGLLLAGAALALGAALAVNLNAPFTGSMEAQAAYQALPARNHLRYGLSRTLGLPNLACSGLEGEDFARHWWINHPPFTALYTAAWFALFGESVAVARLSGILPAVLAGVLVWRAGSGLASPAAGAWSLLLYAAAGLTLWDARRPEYFQPSLLLILLAFVLHLSWRDRPSKGRWAAVVSAVAAGCLVDWMAYLFGAALAVAVLVRDRRAGLLRAAVLLGAMGAAFGLFLLHVLLAVGPDAPGQLAGLLSARVTGPSRGTALLVLAKGAVTHVGAVAVAFSVPGMLPSPARGSLLLLAGFGFAASQFFLEWTVEHAYVAAWFVFPFLVLAGGVGIFRILTRIRSDRLRLAAGILLAGTIAAQGAAYAVFRHRQDTWYLPDRQIISVVRAHLPPGSWVVTPIRGTAEAIETLETDCNFFWGVTRGDELERLRRRGVTLHLLVPRPEAKDGYWSGWSPETRERLGAHPPDPSCESLLREALRREAGPFDLYSLPPP